MITVVSGFPRSGTSLMMQLLRKSGTELVYDDVLPADSSNPQGYFEWQPIKTTGHIRHELYDSLEGKAVKVLNTWLLNFLHHGDGRQFRIYYMLRPLNDVLESHRKVRDLHNLEREDGVTIENMLLAFCLIVNRVLTMSNVKLEFVTFREAVNVIQR